MPFIQIPPAITQGIQTIQDGVRLEWLHNGRIVCFYLDNFNQDAIDTWYNTIETVVLSWDTQYPLLSMTIYQSPHVFITPYLREKSRQMVKTFPYLPGRTALIVQNKLMVTFARAFMRTVNALNNQKHPTLVFHDYAKGLSWLEETL